MPMAVQGTVDIRTQFMPGLVSMEDLLTVSVASFRYDMDGIKGEYAGVASQAVTDDQTNYVYLDSGGSLQVSTTGWPGTKHIRLAVVSAQSGSIVSIIDHRAFMATSESGYDEKVKVSADDTTAGFLNGKLTAGTGIVLTEQTPGGDENLEVKLDAHAASHQNGGADEISVAGLSGTLADPQTPSAHATSHQNGGGDQISLAGLTGESATPQPPKAHESSHRDGGADELAHQNLNGAGSNTHAQIDTHLGSTSNPHSVSKAQVGLGDLTNDIQLKRAAGDINSFASKALPVDADVVLLEDSEATWAKKKVTRGNLMPLFGRNEQRAASESESQTTSTTWQQKQKLTTPTLPAGWYAVVFYAEIKSENNTAADRCEVRVTKDDSEELASSAWVYSNYVDFGGLAYFQLISSAAVEIDMDWRRRGGVVNAYVRRSRLWVFRAGN